MLIRSLAILIIGMLNALASPAGAIVGGEPDTSHRNVAALVTYHPFLPGNPLAPLCSGTLIAPDVVVTAGHFAGFIVGFGLPGVGHIR